MQILKSEYQSGLDKIAEEIQASELLAQYLEEEEDEIYQALREEIEPKIEQIYFNVADNDPLQLFAMETYLFDAKFEGLYLPKLLGYIVLRGEIDENFKFKRPQDHFKIALTSICHSANFDILKQRIGQSIQVGFGLSSDIWITNFLNTFNNKRLLQFLQDQKLGKYRDLLDRKRGYQSFRKQFQSLNFQSTIFPSTYSELKISNTEIEKFLLYRVQSGHNNISLNENLLKFINNERFYGTDEYIGIIFIIANYFDLGIDGNQVLKSKINLLRTEVENLDERYFSYLHGILNSKIGLEPEADQRFFKLLDSAIEDEIFDYYNLMNKVHTSGYVHEDIQEAVRAFYDRYEGMSINNECLRLAIFSYFKKLLSNLPEDSYEDYFELNKIFTIYISIFSNQQFNQDVKGIILTYVRRLLKKFTDKRGKHYQEIKKFVKTTFLDLGFMKEKELVELFKTRRKKKIA